MHRSAIGGGRTKSEHGKIPPLGAAAIGTSPGGHVTPDRVSGAFGVDVSPGMVLPDVLPPGAGRSGPFLRGAVVTDRGNPSARPSTSPRWCSAHRLPTQLILKGVGPVWQILASGLGPPQPGSARAWVLRSVTA